jgi:hypothetical protein
VSASLYRLSRVRIGATWASLGNSPFFRSICILIFVTIFLVHSTMTALTQGPKSTNDKGSVPTLGNFRQQMLPRGFFKLWCGMNDHYLMEVDQQLYMFGGDTAPIELPILEEPGKHCGHDGRSVFFVADGKVMHLDVRTGMKEAIATYPGPRWQIPWVVVSPDLRNIASSKPLQPDSRARHFNMLDLSATDGAVFRIVWKNDSSKLFVVTTTRGPEYKEGVQVFELRQDKLETGTQVPLPGGFFYRKGIFTEDGRELLLQLYPLGKEQDGPDTIFRCEIARSRCSPIISNVANASLSERGLVGTVTQIPRLRKYRVEFRERVTRLFAKQDFDFSERPLLSVQVAPSGNKAVLDWATTQHANCWSGSTKAGGYQLCAATELLDLSGRVK